MKMEKNQTEEVTGETEIDYFGGLTSPKNE